jgi:glutaredoxin
MDALAGITSYPKTFVGKNPVGGCDDLKKAISNGTFK